jgi:hypothetical protein
MAEMADAGEDHGHAQLVGCFDDFLIVDGTTGLDNRGCAGLGYGFETVRERKESIGCGNRTGERQDGLHGTKSGGIDPTHLAGADPNGLAVARVDDGIRLDVLADAPGEEQAAQLVGSGRPPGFHIKFGFSNAAGVGVLKKQATGDMLDDGARRCGTDFDKAEVLFGGEALTGFGSKGRSGDGLDEKLGDFFCGSAIDGAIEADDGAEGGYWIAGQSLLVSVQEVFAERCAAGVGVLDDDDGRLIEFLDEFPASIEIDEIVVTQFLALKLDCAGDAEAGAIGVKGGTLMGVLAVAERLGERKVDAQRRRQGSRVGDGGRLGRGYFGDLIEGVGDGGIVGGSEAESLAGKAPAGSPSEGAGVGFELPDKDRIVGRACDDSDVFEILGGGADHGGPADVDVLDEMTEGDIGLCGGFLESVEVYNHHVDGSDAVGGYGRLVIGVAALVEEAAVDLGVQRLYAAVEHFGEAGKIADVFNREAGFAEGACGTAGRDQLDPEAGERLGKFNQAGFVGYAEQCALNAPQSAGFRCHSSPLYWDCRAAVAAGFPGTVDAGAKHQTTS